VKRVRSCRARRFYYTTSPAYEMEIESGGGASRVASGLAFARDCRYQKGMVYGIRKESRGAVVYCIQFV